MTRAEARTLAIGVLISAERERVEIADREAERHGAPSHLERVDPPAVPTKGGPVSLAQRVDTAGHAARAVGAGGIERDEA